MADKFDKFTERARKVLTLAQEEAQRFNHNYIGTEHLLLGLVREGDGVAARVLSNMGVQLPKVRSAVEFIIGRGDQAPTGDIGLTPRAKKVIELAVDEARRLNHHYIGTEHLLLGLVREGEGIAAGVLESLGVNLEKVRAQVMQVVNQSSITKAIRIMRPRPTRRLILPRLRLRMGSRWFTQRARRSLVLAEVEAKRFNHSNIGTEHLLLGLIREGDGVAARILNDNDVRLQDARQAVEVRKPRRSESVANELYLSKRADKVLDFAVKQAKWLDRLSIGTEHLLLGLVRSDESTAMLVIGDLGVDPVDMRSELIRFIDRASRIEGPSTYSPRIWESLGEYERFTARTRTVLMLAESEARRLGSPVVAAEHLLLGIVKDEDCVAAQMLVNLGKSPQTVRFFVERAIGSREPAPLEKPGLTPEATTALMLAADEARRFNNDRIDTAHVLIGIIRVSEGVAAAVLESLEVSLEAARDEAQRIVE